MSVRASYTLPFGMLPRLDGAACDGADPDLFFPEDEVAARDRRAYTRRAKSICGWCPALLACLQWALDTDQRFGVWGGMTSAERGQVLKAEPRQPSEVYR